MFFGASVSVKNQLFLENNCNELKKWTNGYRNRKTVPKLKNNDTKYEILTIENRWALRFVIFRYTKSFSFIFQRDKAWWSVFILLANIFKKEKLFRFKSPVKREMGGKRISLSRFAIIPHYRGITGPWMTTPGVRECWKETFPWWPVSWTDVSYMRG